MLATEAAWPLGVEPFGARMLSTGPHEYPQLMQELKCKPVVCAGTILGKSGPESAATRGTRWRRARLGKDQLILTERWHKDVDRWYKRIWLQCKWSHTLLAGLIYRGLSGYSRAQTVQILLNSLVLEVVILCMQYAAAPPRRRHTPWAQAEPPTPSGAGTPRALRSSSSTWCKCSPRASSPPSSPSRA